MFVNFRSGINSEREISVTEEMTGGASSREMGSNGTELTGREKNFECFLRMWGDRYERAHGEVS